MEIFKDIKGYEKIYQVSNLGNIKSLAREIISIKNGKFRKQKIEEKILKNNITKTGYCIVHLCKNRKRKAKTVHRLVAEAFIKNPCNYKQINHIDGNKKNNNVKNLEWCNESMNILHSYRYLQRKQHNSTKKVKCVETGETFNSIAEAAAKKDIKASCISHVLNKRAKTAGGYKWIQN